MSTVAATMNRYGLTTAPFLPENAKVEFGPFFDEITDECSNCLDRAGENIATICRTYVPDAQGPEIEKELQATDQAIDKVVGRRMNWLVQRLNEAKTKLPSLLGKPDAAKFPIMAEIRKRLAAMPVTERENYVRAAARAGNADVISAVVFDVMPNDLLPSHLNDALLNDLRASQNPEAYARVSLLEDLMRSLASDGEQAKRAARSFKRR